MSGAHEVNQLIMMLLILIKVFFLLNYAFIKGVKGGSIFS